MVEPLVRNVFFVQLGPEDSVSDRRGERYSDGTVIASHWRATPLEYKSGVKLMTGKNEGRCLYSAEAFQEMCGDQKAPSGWINVRDAYSGAYETHHQVSQQFNDAIWIWAARNISWYGKGELNSTDTH